MRVPFTSIGPFAPPWLTWEQYWGSNDDPYTPRPKFKNPSWMTNNITGPRIHLITHMDVQDTDVPVTAAGGHELLCSYCWKDCKHPTIYVPGTPAKWTPPSLPVQLPRDSGKHFVDQHGYRVPKWQFEPIFQALAIMNPTKRFDDIDIVVNRNTLQKLFAFGSFKRSYDAFHVDLDIIGNTLFIGRKERHPQSDRNSGYGRTFETDFTAEDPELLDVHGHHRVIQYDMGGIQVAIRIEADGYYDSEDSPAFEPPIELPFRNIFNVFEPPNAVITHSKDTHTKALPGGKLTKHHQTCELKSGKGDHASSREQIWFGRTPHLLVAKHSNGLVHKIEEQHLQQEDFEVWAQEPKHQRGLRRLVWFLKELRRVVRDDVKGPAVLLATEHAAPLQIFAAKEGCGALPREIVERFWEGERDA
jgi:hypothetical protein